MITIAQAYSEGFLLGLITGILGLLIVAVLCGGENECE